MYVITKPNTNVIVNLAKTAPAVIKASVRKHGAYTTRWASIEAVKILITSSPCARVARQPKVTCVYAAKKLTKETTSDNPFATVSRRLVVLEVW